MKVNRHHAIWEGSFVDFESDYRKPVYKTVVFSELNKNETYLNPRIKCDILSEREFPKEEMKFDKLKINDFAKAIIHFSISVNQNNPIPENIAALAEMKAVDTTASSLQKTSSSTSFYPALSKSSEAFSTLSWYHSSFA